MVECLLFTLHLVVDSAAAVGVNVRASELLLLNFPAEGSIH